MVGKKGGRGEMWWGGKGGVVRCGGEKRGAW